MLMFFISPSLVFCSYHFTYCLLKQISSHHNTVKSGFLFYPVVIDTSNVGCVVLNISSPFVPTQTVSISSQ